jgi:hypothetical protein
MTVIAVITVKAPIWLKFEIAEVIRYSGREESQDGFSISDQSSI